MKKLSLTVLIAFIFTAGFSQKYAYVDTDYMLSKIPTYKAAQDKLDEFSKGWQKEVEAKYAEVDKKYKEFLAEKVLLSAEMKAQREEEILNLEQVAIDLKDKYFGEEGELYKKRQELVKPIQDEIYTAIKATAVEGNYGIIFDKASGMSMIYTDQKYDISDDILKKLGY